MNRHYTTKPARWQIADKDQYGRLVAAVDSAICDAIAPITGMPSASRQVRGVTILISSNDFSKGRAWISLGESPLMLVSGVDFKVGGSAGQTATAIAAALKAAGVQAAASGSSVLVTVPTADDPYPVVAGSAGGVKNFTIQPEGGYPFSGPWDPPLRVVVP